MTRLTAAMRVWAASVRDRQGCHSGISDTNARLAGALCALLDLRAGLTARNARADATTTIVKILAALHTAGIRQPSK